MYPSESESEVYSALIEAALVLLFLTGGAVCCASNAPALMDLGIVGFLMDLSINFESWYAPGPTTGYVACETKCS